MSRKTMLVFIRSQSVYTTGTLDPGLLTVSHPPFVGDGEEEKK